MSNQRRSCRSDAGRGDASAAAAKGIGEARAPPPDRRTGPRDDLLCGSGEAAAAGCVDDGVTEGEGTADAAEVAGPLHSDQGHRLGCNPRRECAITAEKRAVQSPPMLLVPLPALAPPPTLPPSPVTVLPKAENNLARHGHHT